MLGDNPHGLCEVATMRRHKPVSQKENAQSSVQALFRIELAAGAAACGSSLRNIFHTDPYGISQIQRGFVDYIPFGTRCDSVQDSGSKSENPSYDMYRSVQI